MEYKEINQDTFDLIFLCNSNNIIQIQINSIQKLFLEFIALNKPSLSSLQKFCTSNKIPYQETCNYFYEKGIIETTNSLKYDSLFDRNDLFYEMKFNWFSFTELHLYNKKICLIGCGGIGNNLIQQLLRIGIKNFLLVDEDVIELSNLTRQYLFSKKDVGNLKTDSLKKAILEFNKDANVEVINKRFQKDIYKKIKSYTPDFVFVSADSPQTIVKETYLLFSSKKIPFMHVGYLNDLAIYGPIIDDENLKYFNYIFKNKVIEELKNDFVNNINKSYQAPSFGPINAFVSACAIVDFLQYINDKKPLSYQKKIIVDIFSLKKQIIDFSDPIIGIYSSSSSLPSKFQERTLKCKERLQRGVNLKVVLGDLIFKDVNNYTTGTTIERANEFNSLVKNCNILMPSIGGWNSNSILDLIDYNLIKERKNKIIGFSDTTAIILAIYKMTGTNVYYGQSLLKDYDEDFFIVNDNIWSFKNVILEPYSNYRYANAIVFWDEKTDWNKKPIDFISMKRENNVQYLNNTSHTARLIGGNLNTIVSLLGTKYMPDINEGDILFFEESNKNIAEIERNLSALKNADIFKKIGGLVVGKFESYDDLGSNIKYQDKILEYIDKEIPIILNFDCGHTLPSYILEIGAIYKIDTKKKELVKL